MDKFPEWKLGIRNESVWGRVGVTSEAIEVPLRQVLGGARMRSLHLALQPRGK